MSSEEESDEARYLAERDQHAAMRLLVGGSVLLVVSLALGAYQLQEGGGLKLAIFGVTIGAGVALDGIRELISQGS